MKKGFLFLLFLFSCMSLSALLPPLWEDVDQLKTLLNDKQFGEFFSSGDAIVNIKKQDGGWLIETNHRTIFVEIIPEEQNFPGKAHYSLKFIQH